ncbi:hypothetical protein THIOM_001944 [Candidatus Thiomargarita nelsonii]|uniref:Uncharacterized protein n=1 Tax=Candidatus Thiomargarita nelsonii TaxID=1003181 RepID=A0A176S2L7_9GAMM|nr:hypothetical protein THIOM_001944 [Candidatus Thiomargarita nelsonii]
MVQNLSGTNKADKIIQLISNGKKRDVKMAIRYNNHFDIISWKMRQELVVG